MVLLNLTSPPHPITWIIWILPHIGYLYTHPPLPINLKLFQDHLSLVIFNGIALQQDYNQVLKSKTERYIGYDTSVTIIYIYLTFDDIYPCVWRAVCLLLMNVACVMDMSVLATEITDSRWLVVTADDICQWPLTAVRAVVSWWQIQIHSYILAVKLMPVKEQSKEAFIWRFIAV